MATEQYDFTAKQKDYAVYLPALSSFYATFVGKQQETGKYVDPARVPSTLQHGVESLNFLNNKQGMFTYKWALYSAGHAVLDVAKDHPKEWMVTHRNRADNVVVGDSGGFQIAKGVWEGNWPDTTDKETGKKRKQVLKWMDTVCDYGMTLDVPTWTVYDKKASAKTNIKTYQQAVDVTQFNNEYFIKNRSGDCKFLNVLQGSNHSDADHWYSLMKKYCDPKQYPNDHFNGWGMGGQNMCDLHLILKRLVTLYYDDLLQTGVHDWMHILGTSRLEWACVLTDVQRAVRANYNPNFTISFDCASPFLATANGQVYSVNEHEDRGKWVYRMRSCVDDKKYSTDTRPFVPAILQDGLYDDFTDSFVTQKLKMNDICIYGKGDLNKIGKEGKTSWDSFSYALLMAHNVWMHIKAVQDSNILYDQGKMPRMLVNDLGAGTTVRDIINEVFAQPTKEKSLEIIDNHSTLWMQVVGNRGFSGKKALNANTQFNNLFEMA